MYKERVWRFNELMVHEKIKNTKKENEETS